MTWEGGPRCPGGDHELEGPWVRFCAECGAYVEDIQELVGRGLEPERAVKLARRIRDEAMLSVRKQLAVADWPTVWARLEGHSPTDRPPPELQGELSIPSDDSTLEDQVREAVTDFFRKCGFAVYKLEQGFRPSSCQNCGHGIPVRGTRVTLGVADILVCAPGEMFFVEFKRPKRKARGGYVSNRTDEQELFARDVEGAGGKVYLWRSVEEAQAWYLEYRRRGR